MILDGWLRMNAGDIKQHFLADKLPEMGVAPAQCGWVHLYVAKANNFIVASFSIL